MGGLKSVMGGERDSLDYIILLDNIYYFNELNRKINVEGMVCCKMVWYN